jgi:tetratricopeptide (TPR) repeat protein
MIENILLRFRHRWQIIILIGVMILASSPTPVNQHGAAGLNRAAVALRSGQVMDALNNIDRALNSEPALAQLHLLASDLAYDIGEFERSSQYLDTAIQNLSIDQIGFCRQARGNFGVERGEAPDPNWERFVRECDFAFQQVGDKLFLEFSSDPAEDLIPYLEHLITLNKDAVALRQAYARLQSIYAPQNALEQLRQLSNLQSADNALDRDLLRAINSASEEQSKAFTLAQVGQVFARYQEWSLAELAFQQALSEEPEYIDALAYLGLSEEQLGSNGYAKITAAIARDPQNPRYHVFLAIHHRNKDESEPARAALDEAARLDPENPAIAAQLGSVYAEIGDFTAATQAYLAATDLAPDDSRFWLLLARYSLEYDLQLEKIGLPAARNAVTVEPSDARGYEMLATIQFDLEQYNLAERSLRNALEIDPSSANAQYRYGLLMLTYGRREAADAAFLAATIIDTNGPYGELAARLLN